MGANPTLRLGGRSDTLGHLLAAGPPRNAGLEPLEVALAFADASLRLVLPVDRRRAELLSVAASEMLSQLEPSAAREALDWLLRFDVIRSRGEALRGHAWLNLVAFALGAVASNPQAASLTGDILFKLITLQLRTWRERIGSEKPGDSTATALQSSWEKLFIALQDAGTWGPEHVVGLAKLARGDGLG